MRCDNTSDETTQVMLQHMWCNYTCDATIHVMRVHKWWDYTCDATTHMMWLHIIRLHKDANTLGTCTFTLNVSYHTILQKQNKYEKSYWTSLATSNPSTIPLHQHQRQEVNSYTVLEMLVWNILRTDWSVSEEVNRTKKIIPVIKPFNNILTHLKTKQKHQTQQTLSSGCQNLGPGER